jgi:(p)ppGpp synthase/HD superfamily hydrolase
MNINKALEIAIRAHSQQVDKADEEYILHPLRVMHQFDDKDLMIVSILHDVIEDSNFTLDDLADVGFSREILDAINCLTKRKNETYQSFIDRVKTNSLAVKVKIEDIKDNLDITRLPQPLSEIDLARLKKYHNALFSLLGVSFKRPNG